MNGLCISVKQHVHLDNSISGALKEVGLTAECVNFQHQQDGETEDAEGL